MAGKHFLSDALLSLRESSAQTAGNEEGTRVDMGGGVDKICRAVVTVTVVAAGGTQAVKLQGSSDDSTFYDSPGAVFLDPSDGATIDGTSSCRLFQLVDSNLELRNIECTGGRQASTLPTYGPLGPYGGGLYGSGSNVSALDTAFVDCTASSTEYSQPVCFPL